MGNQEKGLRGWRTFVLPLPSGKEADIFLEMPMTADDHAFVAHALDALKPGLIAAQLAPPKEPGRG